MQENYVFTFFHPSLENFKFLMYTIYEAITKMLISYCYVLSDLRINFKETKGRYTHDTAHFRISNIRKLMHFAV